MRLAPFPAADRCKPPAEEEMESGAALFSAAPPPLYSESVPVPSFTMASPV
jgi:hypothetical protein